MLLGAVADDLTGATDLSPMIARNCMRTIQYIGEPATDADFDDAEAVVVALKSRTIPATEAIALSTGSARALIAAGAEQLMFKYLLHFRFDGCRQYRAGAMDTRRWRPPLGTRAQVGQLWRAGLLPYGLGAAR
jgi:Sugar-binding N-terminal domain